MRGRLTITKIYDEEKGDVIASNPAPVIVDLFTHKLPFYGNVIMAKGTGEFGTKKMLSPDINIGTYDIYLSGAVLTSPNFTVYQEWLFEPEGQSQ